MSVRAAFQAETRVPPLAQILVTRQVTPQIRQTRKYRAIRGSIEAVGVVVEPLVVHPQAGSYVLLDGHLRLDVLKALGVAEANCLLATVDEGYTYNKQINRLSMETEAIAGVEGFRLNDRIDNQVRLLIVIDPALPIRLR